MKKQINTGKIKVIAGESEFGGYLEGTEEEIAEAWEDQE